MEEKTLNILSLLHQRLHSSSFASTYKRDSKCFLRNRVLGLTDLVQLQLNQLVKSLNIEIENGLKILFSDSSTSLSYSKQAFSSARKKLKYGAFIDLNRILVKSYYTQGNYKLYKDKYLLLAVDGSLLQLPESKGLALDFERWKNQTDKGMLMGRCSVLYDVLNHQVLDSCFDNYTVSERCLYKQHIANIKEVFANTELPPKLYLMDRERLSKF